MPIFSASRPQSHRVLSLIAAAGIGLACKTTEPGPVAVQLALATPPSPAAISGVALTQQPVIQLQDAGGNPVAEIGRQVFAVLATQGGTLVGTLEVKTDAQGKATFTNLALSGPTGSRTLRFDSPGLQSVAAQPVVVGPGAASTLASFAGNFQNAPAGTSVAVALAVLVTDAAGNPVPGAAVSFAVASGGGSIGAGTGSTNAAGVATLAGWTLGAVVGLNTVTATSPAVTGASVTFTATGILGPAAVLTIVAGTAQSATVGATTAVAPSAKLADAFGNPVAGVVVTFAPGIGGGAVIGGAATTNTQGVATAGSWTLGLLPGANTITASRAGVPTVTFDATGIDFPVAAVEAGDHHSCALVVGGQAYCWGFNSTGQVGNGTVIDTKAPSAVGGGLLFTALSAGVTHTCGLVGDGDAYCWGENFFGQLGDSSTANQSLPTQVVGGLKFTSLVTGQAHTCGLIADGSAYCWGAGLAGRLGDSTLFNRFVPTAVIGGRFFSRLTAGLSHTCGIATDGTAHCWGGNGNGRLGDGTTVNRLQPTPVLTALTFTAISAGGSFTCAIATAGAGQCWGNGAAGLLGTGNITSQLVPTPIGGGLALTAIAAGVSHTCALVIGGQAYCWGFNASGELGDGTTTIRTMPTLVLGGITWSAIRSGAEHSCARATAGGAYCWGRNDVGTLGDNTVLDHRQPAGVVRP